MPADNGQAPNQKQHRHTDESYCTDKPRLKAKEQTTASGQLMISLKKAVGNTSEKPVGNYKKQQIQSQSKPFGKYSGKKRTDCMQEKIIQRRM